MQSVAHRVRLYMQQQQFKVSLLLQLGLTDFIPENGVTG
jgi:hypothetical protein